MYPRPMANSWLDELNDEDIAFLKRFVLASGSLKELAATYGVSYPTIRLRLDKLVEKIRLLERSKSTDAFERTLLGAYADGKLDALTMKSLLAAHQREVRARENRDANENSNAGDGGDAGNAGERSAGAGR